MKKILFLSIVLLSLVACSKGESKAEKQTEKRDSIITYTTSNGNIVDINNKNVFGAAITSNIYGHEGGKIVFDEPVTSIGYEAFAGCSSLTSVTIPNSVTSIGNYAFVSCSSLTSVNIPNSVTSIGEGAFEGCFSLTSDTIPNVVTSIEDEVFYSFDTLPYVTITDSVTTVEVHAVEVVQ